MLIIPAIDILEGKVVRFIKGDFSTAKNYSKDPIHYAMIYKDLGYERIHVVDLNGSRCGDITTQKIIEEIKLKTDLQIQYGGGIRSLKDAEKLISSGVNKIIIGSLPFINQSEFKSIIEKISVDKIIIAADTLNGEIYIKGWSENSGLKVTDYIIECMSHQLKNFLITDINKDGLLRGPNFQLYKSLIELFPNILLTASGGISSINDIIELEKLKCNAAVVGKAIYENKIDLKELAKFDK